VLQSTRRSREATAIAVALLGTAGVAGLVLGPYVFGLGLWVVQQPSTRDATTVLVIDGILGAAIVATGVMAIVAARALWRGLDWAAPAGLLVAMVLLGGMAVVGQIGIWIEPYWLVVALALLIAGTVVVSSKRGS
jgi:hypothetical protein